MIHPSFDIQSTLGEELKNKKIVICITGSVAAVKSSELARLLMRHGANVHIVMSKDACKIISPELMHWSSGNPVITEITGKVEHVALAGNTKTKADLVLVAPTTANTIGKVAAGIDDTVVTTFLTTAIGEKIPIIMVPGMHLPMYEHPKVKDNIKYLESMGIEFINPKIEEGKAKSADNIEICNKVISTLSNKKNILKNKKVLITAGRTIEYIDDIRVITNNSSGKMGAAIAQTCLDYGAEVFVVYGKGSVDMPSKASVFNVESTEDMNSKVLEILKQYSINYAICVAAVNDWQPIKKFSGKIPTANNSLNLELVPTPKIIDNIKKASKSTILTAFRALPNMPEDEAIKNGIERMEKADAQFIAINNISNRNTGFESDNNQMIFINSEKEIFKTDICSKNIIAQQLIDFICK